MNIRKMLSILGLMLAFTIILPVVHADDRDQAIRFTFSQPVQIPGQVLPAGTYRFQLADDIDRNLVQIFREDRTLVATVSTIPRQREATDPKVTITLADRGANQTEAIVAWFYLGKTEGHEFLYPKQQAQELAHATQQTFVTGD